MPRSGYPGRWVWIRFQRHRDSTLHHAQSSLCIYPSYISSGYSPRMSASSILLRVLLCLTLALNSMATAAMSVRMAKSVAATANMQVATSQESATGASPCHGHDGKAMAPTSDKSVATDQKAATGDDTKSDCCKSASCQCACLHGVQAVMTASLRVVPTHDRNPNASPLHTGHAGPAIPHLIRPPIG